MTNRAKYFTFNMMPPLLAVYENWLAGEEAVRTKATLALVEDGAEWLKVNSYRTLHPCWRSDIKRKGRQPLFRFSREESTTYWVKEMHAQIMASEERDASDCEIARLLILAGLETLSGLTNEQH